MSVTQKGRRSKGTTFELDLTKKICAKLGLEYGKDLVRTPYSGMMEGWGKGDICAVGEFKNVWRYFIECKADESVDLFTLVTQCEKSPVIRWYQKAVEQAKDYEIPIVIFKKNYRPLMIAISSVDTLPVAVNRIVLQGQGRHPGSDLEVFRIEPWFDEILPARVALWREE